MRRCFWKRRRRTQRGIVYVYDLSEIAAGADIRSPLATIKNPSPGVDDRFGKWMSTSGSTLAVSAHLADASAIRSGAVYCYDLSNIKHRDVLTVPTMTVHNPFPDNGDEFGFRIDLDGNKLSVGARLDDRAGNSQGAAYIYKFDVAE